MKYKTMKFSLISQLLNESRPDNGGYRLSDQEGPVDEMVRQLNRDPELSPIRERVLEYANSDSFGLKHRVTDTKAAVLIVGPRLIKEYVDKEIAKLESESRAA